MRDQGSGKPCCRQGLVPTDPVGKANGSLCSEPQSAHFLLRGPREVLSRGSPCTTYPVLVSTLGEGFLQSDRYRLFLQVYLMVQEDNRKWH